MDIIEYLLVCLGEEGSEISQTTSKALRFRLDDRNVLNPTGPTNKDRLIDELNDLLGVSALLVKEGVLPSDWQSPVKQSAKIAKVCKFIEYSREKGTLIIEGDEPYIEKVGRQEVEDLLDKMRKDVKENHLCLYDRDGEGCIICGLTAIEKMGPLQPAGI